MFSVPKCWNPHYSVRQVLYFVRRWQGGLPTTLCASSDWFLGRMDSGIRRFEMRCHS